MTTVAEADPFALSPAEQIEADGYMTVVRLRAELRCALALLEGSGPQTAARRAFVAEARAAIAESEAFERRRNETVYRTKEPTT